jgi:hypothetical protein
VKKELVISTERSKEVFFSLCASNSIFRVSFPSSLVATGRRLSSPRGFTSHKSSQSAEDTSINLFLKEPNAEYSSIVKESIEKGVLNTVLTNYRYGHYVIVFLSMPLTEFVSWRLLVGIHTSLIGQYMKHIEAFASDNNISINSFKSKGWEYRLLEGVEVTHQSVNKRIPFKIKTKIKSDGSSSGPKNFSRLFDLLQTKNDCEWEVFVQFVDEALIEVFFCYNTNNNCIRYLLMLTLG